jgi:hypothetical protein
MSIRNPYKKRLRFDRVVITPADELGMTKVRRDGKTELIEDVVIELDNCWKEMPTQTVLIRLLKGTTGSDELLSIYTNAIMKKEKKKAMRERADEKDPFPFRDQKQRFVKDINTLKVMGLVEQPGNDASGTTMSYNLSDDGVAFVKKKIMDTIREENFDIFMALLGKKTSRVYFSYIVMKLAEQRHANFDQILVLIDDLESSQGQELMREYITYLREIEEEDVNKIEIPIMYGEVVLKVSTLVKKGLVKTEDGKYSLTKLGNDVSNRFTESLSPIIDFLIESGLVDLEKQSMDDGRERYMISLTPEGVLVAEEIKRYLKNNSLALLKNTTLNDHDLHETSGTLPVEDYVKIETEKKKNLQMSIYTVPVYNVSIKDTLRGNASSVMGSISIFFIIFAFFSFFLIPSSAVMGLSLVMVCVVLSFCFCSGYAATVDTMKKKRNMSAQSIIERQIITREMLKLTKKQKFMMFWKKLLFQLKK